GRRPGARAGLRPPTACRAPAEEHTRRVRGGERRLSPRNGSPRSHRPPRPYAALNERGRDRPCSLHTREEKPPAGFVLPALNGENRRFWGGRLRPLLFPLPQDRKSTRLNSSHVKISYAVFCL